MKRLMVGPVITALALLVHTEAHVLPAGFGLLLESSITSRAIGGEDAGTGGSMGFVWAPRSFGAWAQFGFTDMPGPQFYDYRIYLSDGTCIAEICAGSKTFRRVSSFGVPDRAPGRSPESEQAGSTTMASIKA